MKTIYKIIKTFLERNIGHRERRFRSKGIILLLREKYNNIGQPNFPIDKLEDFALDYVSYERIWRLVQSENKELRGEDYEDKIVYEQNKEIELGYESRFHEKVKQLELL